MCCKMFNFLGLVLFVKWGVFFVWGRYFRFLVWVCEDFYFLVEVFL